MHDPTDEKPRIARGFFLLYKTRAGEQGLEPQYHPPEGCVLPLDDSPMYILLPITFSCLYSIVILERLFVRNLASFRTLRGRAVSTNFGVPKPAY
jgi:hypothetical protein